MAQLEHIEAIERRLWSAADTLRANSSYASNEYFLPVMGLVFLRHAYSRYLGVKDEIEAALPTRGGVRRAPAKEDFSQKGAIFLRPEAQFDSLVALPDGADRAEALIRAMESIEADYESLRGVLPKAEYRELSNDVLGQLLRTLNPEELKHVSGDVFGRIYEYFLTQFADQKAHDGGEFFTPISLVSLIANVLEPERGIVLDPACGSGGMFVQSARVVERHDLNPTERLTFRGLEKNDTTLRLGKMNLAVHGLEGDIQQAITYYEDPHELCGRASYVMSNPPFNVDEIDAEKIKNDVRLPFGLPGVNKKGKVTNGNYVWISYFYSYLNATGRAGFVMSSQASSAGRGEAKVRRKLVETGDVEVMISIRSNFFYTRTVPCELWFFNRAKDDAMRDKVLMIDARNVYRKVTRKIYDFSPEQMQNLLAIVWLYRGERERYLDLVAGYCRGMLDAAAACEQDVDDDGTPIAPLKGFFDAMTALRATMPPSLTTGPDAAVAEFNRALSDTGDIVGQLNALRASEIGRWDDAAPDNDRLKAAVGRLAGLADAAREVERGADQVMRIAGRLIETLSGGRNGSSREIAAARRTADEARQVLVDHLKRVRYLYRQARWLTERFPDAELCAVPGLVKLVDRTEIAANDWSLTPGRYVGVAPEEVDENFDFAETMREIHVELAELDTRAAELAATIGQNLEKLI